jgi:hypothetical protein
MLLIVLKTLIVAAMMILPLLIIKKTWLKRKKTINARKTAKIVIPKDHNDTSDARYAINEHGYLEEIHGKFPKHAN